MSEKAAAKKDAAEKVAAEKDADEGKRVVKEALEEQERSKKRRHSDERKHNCKVLRRCEGDEEGIGRREWKPEEESSVIAYMKEKGGWWLSHGDKVWQEMSSAGICPRRTSSAVEEHFLDVMTPDLSRFGTSRQELRDCDPRHALNSYKSHVFTFITLQLFTVTCLNC